MKEQWRQLDFVTPQEIEVDRDLHARVVETKNYFHERERAGDVNIRDYRMTSRQLVWQDVDYHPRPINSWYESARGYLMVEPDDIAEAARIIDIVYQERKENGKYGEFKWLMAKIPPILFFDDRYRYARDEGNMGMYVAMKPIDPRVVLYEYSPNAIQDILSQVASLDAWKVFEDKRRAAYSGDTPPIRGDSHFTDQNGDTWYSLSYNTKPGHSKRH